MLVFLMVSTKYRVLKHLLLPDNWSQVIPWEMALWQRWGSQLSKGRESQLCEVWKIKISALRDGEKARVRDYMETPMGDGQDIQKSYSRPGDSVQGEL